MSEFIVSGFADEIDEKVKVQFEHLNKLGISYFEPRGINGTNISEINDEQLKELKADMEKYGIKVSSIGSPIGKIGIKEDFDKHLEKLARVIEIAKALGTKYIRIFSFFIPQGENPADYRDEVMSRMKKMCELAEKEGVMLLHENEKDIYGDKPERCLDIFETVKSPALKGVFDPANFVQCGVKVYPEAFKMLKDHIVYMHIKDALVNGEVVPAGYGIGGVEEIIKELDTDGYEGFLSLEPHLGSFRGLENLETGDEMLKLPESTPEKFTMAYQSLQDILEGMDK